MESTDNHQIKTERIDIVPEDIIKELEDADAEQKENPLNKMKNENEVKEEENDIFVRPTKKKKKRISTPAQLAHLKKMREKKALLRKQKRNTKKESPRSANSSHQPPPPPKDSNEQQLDAFFNNVDRMFDLYSRMRTRKQDASPRKVKKAPPSPKKVRKKNQHLDRIARLENSQPITLDFLEPTGRIFDNPFN